MSISTTPETVDAVDAVDAITERRRLTLTLSGAAVPPPPISSEKPTIGPRGEVSAPAARSTRARLATGHIIPGTRLRVTGLLGEGATAVVYKGVHTELRSPLAIKVLRDPSPSELARARFLEEARTTSEIDSRYVVDVVDFGELEDGRLFYAMERLDSSSLYDIVRREGSLPVDRAVSLLRMACKGLAAVHDAGIVHRDIKPANLVLRSYRGREQLVLVDFGISTSTGPTVGQVCGTPAFMAPEQIVGAAVDGSADLYALGCCAYEMLCGRHFIEPDDVTVMLSRHLSSERPQFPESSDVPKPLQDVVLRCLSRDPADRYASAIELEYALCEAQLAGGTRVTPDHLEPPEVDEARRQQLLRAWVQPTRRSRLRRSLTAVAAGLLLVGATAAWSSSDAEAQGDDREQIACIAAEARDAAEREQYLYPETSEDYDTAYERILALERWEGIERSHALSMASALRAELADCIETRADELWRVPDTQEHARELYAQALVFEPSRERAWSRAKVSAQEVSILHDKAKDHALDLVDERDVPPLVRAVDSTAEALLASAPSDTDESSTPDSAVSHDEPAPPEPTEPTKPTKPLADQDPTSNGEVNEDRAADAKPESSASGSPQASRPVATAHHSRQWVQRARRALRKGNRQSAREMFQRAVDLDGGNDLAYAGLADVYFEQGRHERAFHFARLAVRHNPRNPRHHVRLGDSYYRMARRTQALREYQRAANLGSRRASLRLAELRAG